MIYRDVLYGEIQLPDWLDPFTRLPEFVRLRGVRLSNIDSLQYKDFGAAVRYDHGIAVAYLATRAAIVGRLCARDAMVLTLSALLHDVGTPPFGHTLEIVLGDIDHEVEAWNALGLDRHSANSGFNVVGGQAPLFRERLSALARKTGIDIEPELIGETINGLGALGFYIKGSVDLDNADNVLRGAHYMGLPATGELALSIAEWLGTQDRAPTLEGDVPAAVRRWIEIRDEYYRLFFDCSEAEVGRQALLQFMIREARRHGLPRESILKTTDDGLISTVLEYGKFLGDRGEYLVDAVRKFRSLDPVTEVLRADLDNPEDVAAVKSSSALNWMEVNFRRKGFVPMAFLARRRFPDTVKPPGSLFSYPLAKLSLYALYEPKSAKIKKTSEGGLDRINLELTVAKAVSATPWRSLSDDVREDLRLSLSSWGDWSFVGSRNESLHAYPSTYVHSIPNAFLRSLRLAGEVVVDPFCGSGISGFVAANMGCRSVCSDINQVAVLMSKVRNSFIPPDTRARLRELDRLTIDSAYPSELPQIGNLSKWHHPDTAAELAQIKGHITDVDSIQEREFLELCFSAILTSSTARRGKQHGWFADNTPLSADQSAPPYVNAIELFLSRLDRNLRILESGYASFVRRGEDPEIALSRVSVQRANANNSDASSLGLEPNSAGAIVTSPPYLGMSDYSLGQRLSYAWLYPGLMERDFAEEIGARRRRFNAERALAEYRSSMAKFVELCTSCLRKEGFVATVLGEPAVARFGGHSTIGLVDELFAQAGYEKLWENWRPISWHRNHGYERLKSEKLTVYVKRD